MWEKAWNIFTDCAQLVIIAKKWGVSTLDILDLREMLNTTDNNLVEAYYQEYGVPSKQEPPDKKGAQSNPNFERYKELVSTRPHITSAQAAEILGVHKQSIYNYEKKLNKELL